jgi:glycerate 2-kinase
VAGASGAPFDSGFGLIDNDATAVIEIAQVVGLTDAAVAAVPVERRSTRGLGELVRLLLDAGVRNYLSDWAEAAPTTAEPACSRLWG